MSVNLRQNTESFPGLPNPVEPIDTLLGNLKKSDFIIVQYKKPKKDPKVKVIKLHSMDMYRVIGVDRDFIPFHKQRKGTNIYQFKSTEHVDKEEIFRTIGVPLRQEKKTE